MKGGAAGGGYAQVVPMENINLHFTGDFHAIGSAHNLLAALIDNHIYWGNELGLDTRRIGWRRVVDMNDRALRSIVSSLGGVANGFPREDGFDITVASEVMAVFCLATDLADLERRLGRMVVGQTRDRELVTAEQLKGPGPMTVLLKDALMPNLVQTLENNPAFIHGGPFANIAHGCNSVMATRLALKLCDYVVTEAGFGADLGAEKFFDIKCRKAGLTPGAAVIVATIRALKMHGGVGREDLGKENLAAVRKGLANLGRHVTNVRKFGVPAVVAINQFTSDTEAEHDPGARLLPRQVRHRGDRVLALGRRLGRHRGARRARRRACWTAGRPWMAAASASSIRTRCRCGTRCAPSRPRSTAPRTSSPTSGCATSSRTSRTAASATSRSASPRPSTASRPIPTSRARPAGHVVPIREVRLSGGAEFLVVICGEIMTMPGLPRVPAAHSIRLDEQGLIQGLF